MGLNCFAAMQLGYRVTKAQLLLKIGDTKVSAMPQEGRLTSLCSTVSTFKTSLGCRLCGKTPSLGNRPKCGMKLTHLPDYTQAAASSCLPSRQKLLTTQKVGSSSHAHAILAHSMHASHMKFQAAVAPRSMGTGL